MAAAPGRTRSQPASCGRSVNHRDERWRAASGSSSGILNLRLSRIILLAYTPTIQTRTVLCINDHHKMRGVGRRIIYIFSVPETELTKLRRARIRCHKKLKQAEELVAGYQAKLAT